MIQITDKLFGGDIKDKDQHLNILENVLPLRLEVLLHEHVLTTAVPESQYQISQKSHSVLVHIDSESDSVGITSQIVREND